MARAFVACLALLVAGCASVPYQRLSETAWGYVWVSPRGPVIFIAPDEQACQRLSTPPLGRCRPLRFGDGRSYWLIFDSRSRTMVGAETKGVCESLRPWRGESPCTLDRVSFPTEDGGR